MGKWANAGATLAGPRNLAVIWTFVSSASRRTSYKGFPASAEAGRGLAPSPHSLL